MRSQSMHAEQCHDENLKSSDSMLIGAKDKECIHGMKIDGKIRMQIEHFQIF